MSKEATIDDALLTGWDASGAGHGFDGHLMSHNDQEVIEMLHTEAWSPTARSARS